MGSPSYFDFARNAEVSTNLPELDVGELQASQTSLAVGGSSQLRQPVLNPFSSTSSFTVNTQYFKNGSPLTSSEVTLSPGQSSEFTTSESYSTSQSNTYTTEITNKDKGETINRGPLEVTWLEISTGSLTASTTTPDVGNTVTLTLGVGNPTTSNATVNVSIREFGISIFSNSATIPPGGSTSFQTTVTKSKVSSFIYDALIEYEGTTAESNDVTVEWKDPTAFSGVRASGQKIGFYEGTTAWGSTFAGSLSESGWGYTGARSIGAAPNTPTEGGNAFAFVYHNTRTDIWSLGLIHNAKSASSFVLQGSSSFFRSSGTPDVFNEDENPNSSTGTTSDGDLTGQFLTGALEGDAYAYSFNPGVREVTIAQGSIEDPVPSPSGLNVNGPNGSVTKPFPASITIEINV